MRARVAFFMSLAAVAPALVAAAPSASLEMGRRVYQKACATCHGVSGDGKGPAARYLRDAPRDFTAAQYKFRTTQTGELPTDDDLFRTISKGVPGTEMPAWERHLTATERRAVVQFVKTFEPDFEKYERDEPLVIAEPPPATHDSVSRGKEVYAAMKCAECHGKEGRGDGPAAANLKDDQGLPMRAYDFTSGQYRGGSDPRDIYRTFNTGLNGTPMPSYYYAMTEEDRWALVYFVRSLESEPGWLDYLFGKRASWE